MTYQAVLFDLDGTLLDTLEDLADSMNAVLSANSFPTHQAEAYKTFVGDGVANLVRRALPAGTYTDEDIRRLVQLMRAEYARRWKNKTKPYDGVDEMLRALADRGLKLAVLSNKPDDTTKLCVQHFLGNHRFDVVQGVADDVAPKPDPAGAKRIRETLNLPVEAFLYLGDTNTDMQTATAAGMYAIGATWGFRTADELLQHGAKTLIDHPMELIGLL
ncbi:MAG: HAD family hydrolase [Phycisphaerae bacterium]|nr:HAD family hydrolase [Phycisphaerae bacterium]